MTDEEFIDRYGAETSYFDLIVLKKNNSEKFISLKRQYERTLDERKKAAKQYEEEQRRDWQKEQDRRSYETRCSECGASYRRSRDGGTPLCGSCYDKFLKGLA